MRNLNQSNLEVSIGLSRKWDAREAGRDVAKNIIEKLKMPPSFILLFSTIHYKKHGGFKELLNGVWDVLPRNTPLIGGTIASFINNYGCFSRGVTALAVSSPNIDLTLGVGKYSRRNPKRSATSVAEMIKKGLKNSNYKNKLLINMISAGKLPNLPFIGRVQIIKSKYIGWIATHIGMKLFPIIGYGLGKEEEIIDNLGENIPDYYIIGGSTLDSGDMLDNFQFIGEHVFTNSIVALGCSTSLPIYLKTNINLIETKKTLRVTSSTKDGRIIKSLDNRPAKEQILKALDINDEQINDLGPFYYRTSNYFPITFEEDKRYISGVGGFFGDNVYLGYKIRGKKIKILSITGKHIIDLIDSTLREKLNLPFLFMTSSFILLNTLGSKSYKIKEKIDENFKNTPYLMVCPVNENTSTPNNPAVARVYSFNVMSFDTEDIKNYLNRSEEKND